MLVHIQGLVVQRGKRLEGIPGEGGGVYSSRNFRCQHRDFLPLGWRDCCVLEHCVTGGTESSFLLFWRMARYLVVLDVGQACSKYGEEVTFTTTIPWPTSSASWETRPPSSFLLCSSLQATKPPPLSDAYECGCQPRLTASATFVLSPGSFTEHLSLHNCLSAVPLLPEPRDGSVTAQPPRALGQRL